MPNSMHSPMLNPIPFTKADYTLFNWNDLAARTEKRADNCYTPTYLLNPAVSSQYVNIANCVAKMINEKYLPPEVNFTTPV